MIIIPGQAASPRQPPTEDECSTLKQLFDTRVRTQPLSGLTRQNFKTPPGLQGASAEDGSGDQLNWWQMSSVQRICEFLNTGAQQRQSEGIVLADAPGLGKTLTVLSVIALSIEDAHVKEEEVKEEMASPSRPAAAPPAAKTLTVIFAGKDIVPQWAEQVGRHFDPAASKLETAEQRYYHVRRFNDIMIAVADDFATAASTDPHAFIIAEKESRKPSSRAARRRELVARADSSRARAGKKHEQQPEKRKYSHKPSPPQHTPTRRSEESRPSLPAEPRTGKHKQAHRSKEGHADGSASKRAWSVMRQKMSEAASR